MLKTFLKPGWVLMLLFVVAFSYLAFSVLAPWQLGKDDDIVERNENITHAYEADPQPIDRPVWNPSQPTEAIHQQHFEPLIPYP